MAVSRRAFLTGAAAGTVPLALPGVAGGKSALHQENVLELFSGLPGKVAVKVDAPAVRGGRELLSESNASERMFVGSAIKTFALCEALRQSHAPDVVTNLAERQLVLDESVWNSDSQSLTYATSSGRSRSARRWRR
jgi:beta-lactamase class A